MPPVRKLRQKGGFAALVDSANVAGWLRRTRAVGNNYGKQDRQLLRNTMEALEVLTLHQGCEPFGTEWAHWIPREWNAAADSLATRAMERKEDAFFLNGRWHTDKWTQVNVVLLSDTGILLLHRNCRELLARPSSR